MFRILLDSRCLDPLYQVVGTSCLWKSRSYRCWSRMNFCKTHRPPTNCLLSAQLVFIAPTSILRLLWWTSEFLTLSFLTLANKELQRICHHLRTLSFHHPHLLHPLNLSVLKRILSLAPWQSSMTSIRQCLIPWTFGLREKFIRCKIWNAISSPFHLGQSTRSAGTSSDELLKTPIYTGLISHKILAEVYQPTHRSLSS